MTLANLVHGLRTDGTGGSPAPLYGLSYCRHGVTNRFGGYLDAPRDDVDGGPSVGLHRHAADRGCAAAAPENAEGNDRRPNGGYPGGRATVQPPGGLPPQCGGIPDPAGRRRG